MTARSRSSARATDELGFLLHSTAWRETSLVLDVYSRRHGRIALVAKGAKRPHSALRPVLCSFQPLALSWSGAGDVKTLVRAEWIAPLRRYSGPAMMSAWYMNELLLRLLPREDAHENLYAAYDAALTELASGARAAGALRRFEWILLREIGYGLDMPTPDFADPAAEPALRRLLREHIEDQLEGRPLVTRKVLHSLQRA
ncbi:DNA repair protein RecO [Verticiella sediminum]|uniref:DNA repair protein RecO n=1 Tax=Verticiella sediminum TaxID=1247510 RepID=A0A556AS06_9BURK|nr:DNA repair protein RecO [Verticiella sediminum]TSH95734.1 DNA repair protein RecO [Verticiella sediminum]